MLSSSGATAETLDRFYEDLRDFSTSPLWLVQEEALVAEPKSKALPFLWRWRDLQPPGAPGRRPHRHCRRRAPRADDAQPRPQPHGHHQLHVRRPADRHARRGCRAHRHSPAALRFMIDSQGGSTTVNGDRIPMYPGDLVLTPNWTWHDHANETADPIIWLDGLDIPLVHMLEAVYYEPYPEDVQPVTEPTDSSLTRYGAGTLRPSWETSGAAHSPLMHYPWKQTWETLQRLAPRSTAAPSTA